MITPASKQRLVALVNAIIDVREDPGALKLLEEQLESTADGTGTDAHDLQHLFTTALAHCYAHQSIERTKLQRRIDEARLSIAKDVEAIVEAPAGLSYKDCLKWGGR